MSRADTWMPLYIGDYLADTMHLSGPEHGAYLLLIMHYWRNGPLPDDDRSLASIARFGRKEWMSEIGPVVRGFFQARDGRLHHKRIDEELARAKQNSSKRKAAADARWEQHRSKLDANAYANASDVQSKRHDPRARLPSPSPSPREERIPTTSDALGASPPADGVPVDVRTELFRDGLDIVRRLTGKPDESARKLLGGWLKGHDDCALVLDVLRCAERDRPASPVPWIVAALNARRAAEQPSLLPAEDDPWGLQAWARQQPDITTQMCGSQPAECINGWDVTAVGTAIAEAASIEPTRRVAWDALGAWLRADLTVTAPHVLAAVRDVSKRLSGVSSIKVFDGVVRDAVRKAA